MYFFLWSYLGSKWVYILILVKVIDWFLLSVFMFSVLDKRFSFIYKSIYLKRILILI